MNNIKKRIIHFVTPDGTGATRVAVDLALFQKAGDIFDPVIVFRRKKKALPETMERQLRNGGVEFRYVDNLRPKLRTISRIKAVCREYKPAIFIAHGSSEHIWGRKAAFAAGVPCVAHVEHNIEKYPLWRLWQSRRLARRTQATICVSGAVEAHARKIRIASANTKVVHNGIDIERYSKGGRVVLAGRSDTIVMAARFGAQKDHATLIRAVRRLAAGGWRGQLLLAGGGKEKYRAACQKLVAQLGVGAQVKFIGFAEDVPALLRSCRVAVLSTFYEGLPLVLAEAMAANCLVVASDAPGVRDILTDGETGYIFRIGDDEALANILARALRADDSIQRIADNGFRHASLNFSTQQMAAHYDALLTSII